MLLGGLHRIIMIQSEYVSVDLKMASIKTLYGGHGKYHSFHKRPEILSILVSQGKW